MINKVVATLDRRGLPDDFMDIHHHIKNVSVGIVTNETERLLAKVIDNMAKVYPHLGKYRSVEWSGTVDNYIVIEMWW